MQQRLTSKNYIGFGLGDFAFNLFFQGTTLFLLFFYTDILKIDAVQAGTIFLVATIWDAITDPIMGFLANKTRSRFGRYRVYLLLIPIPLGIFYSLLFFQVNFTGWSLIVWVMSIQLLYRTVFTIGNIPYSSLSSEMTKDSHERSKLAAYRMFLGYAGAMMVSVLTGKLMNFLGWSAMDNGYFYIAIIFSVFAALLFFISYQNTFELPQDIAKQHFKIREVVKMLKVNTPFWQLCSFIVVGMAGVVIFYQSLSYFFKYNLNTIADFGNGMLFLFACLMAALPFWLWLSSKIGKRKTLIIGCFVIAFGSLSFYYNPLTVSSLWWVYAHMGLIGIGIGCAAFAFWAMLPDTVEFGEWKSGIRAEAVIFGLGLFFLKLGLGIGSFLLGLLLDYYQYSPNIQQSLFTLKGIHGITTLAMAIPAILIMVIMFNYKLDEDLYKKISNTNQ
jgi:GPH family glycoside/pentoside/hexuronide:cation symporter